MKTGTIKIILMLILLPLILLATFQTQRAFAEEESTLTVYASKEEQEAVFNVLPDELRDSAIPGSVTPLYYYIIYDESKNEGYRNGDAIVLSKVSPYVNEYTYVVSMKDISYFDKTWNSGIVECTVKNGVITARGPLLGETAEYGISMHYADFAEDIRVLAGREEMIDPQYVRLVRVYNFGYCFYINDGVDEFFYVFYSVNWTGDIDLAHGARILRVGEDLERAAGEVKEHLERERKIQAGEIESGGASSPDVETAVVEFHPATGDASDIEAYLGVKIDSFKTHFPEAFKAPVVWPYFVAGGVAIVAAAAVAVVLIVKKRRARASGEAPAEAAG
jgi:hypothetical protein